MSYNGSGTFQINTSGQPVVAGTVISSTAFNALTADLATGLSTAITKDGQTTTTARIVFAQGINSSLATDTSSGATGSIFTAGGIGAAKAVYVGTTLTVAGSSAFTGAITVTGLSTFTGAIAVDNVTDSTSTTTGSIQTDGGLGVAKAVYVGTTLNVAGLASFTSTGAVLLAKGTTAQQPAGVAGYLRFNTDTTQFEGYNGSAWSSVGGAAISNDTSTATNVYPLFANATSGSATTIYTGNAKLLYKPSTGEFTSSVLTAGNGIVVNSQSVATSYTIAAGYSGTSAGPITIASGQTVTVASGSRWVVL
jgi:hypothetical protein